MKKFLSLIFVLISQCAFAAGWQENWANSRECINNAELDKALQYLNLAIEDPEANPVVYVDRAAIFVYNKEYKKAEVDIDFALASDKLSEFDKPEAHHVKSRVCYYLDQHGEGLAHFNIWKNTSKSMPEITETETCAIIRNITADEFTKQVYYQIYKIFDECESIEDVIKIDNSTLMIKKKISDQQKDCGCGCGGAKKQDVQEKFGFFSDCHWSCDMAVYYGELACALFPNWPCRLMCIGLVKKWEPGCHSCCDSGNFYETCVRQYKELVQEVTCTGCYWAGRAADLGWGFNEL